MVIREAELTFECLEPSVCAEWAELHADRADLELTFEYGRSFDAAHRLLEDAEAFD